VWLIVFNFDLHLLKKLGLVLNFKFLIHILGFHESLLRLNLIPKINVNASVEVRQLIVEGRDSLSAFKLDKVESFVKLRFS